MVDIQSATTENRWEKKEKRRNHRTKIEWPVLWNGHKKEVHKSEFSMS